MTTGWEELLGFASTTTAARVEERCRDLRYGSRDSTEGALRAHERRTLSLRRDRARCTSRRRPSAEARAARVCRSKPFVGSRAIAISSC
jgi:hypothetical protein